MLIMCLDMHEYACSNLRSLTLLVAKDLSTKTFSETSGGPSDDEDEACWTNIVRTKWQNWQSSAGISVIYSVLKPVCDEIQ